MFFFSSVELNYDPLFLGVLEHPLLQRLFSYRNPYTSEHQIQVAKFAVDIAKHLGYGGEKLFQIRTAALIHDIGKINVPMEILSKPGKLTLSEFNLIREHPQLGYDIISNIDMHHSIKRIVLEHHEHLDGSGYPNQLKNSNILDETKILTVADVVCAMLENRPYRTSLTKSSVRKELLKFRGIFYSPEVVDVALDLLKGLRVGHD